ncbi:POR [Mytilus edulis]|uniref:NADPH--hemoprotein reductase n=1 Tax=Mytilus edulis TaxID=6550 RepID=A0A8S3V3X2_MYTED|nr:POR [Mytilus edulis]
MTVVKSKTEVSRTSSKIGCAKICIAAIMFLAFYIVSELRSSDSHTVVKLDPNHLQHSKFSMRSLMGDNDTECREVRKTNHSDQCDFIKNTDDCALDEAFGNGAPDIFSAIAAVGNAKNGDAGLAFGALLGAGVFVTTVVAGTIAIICPFDAMQRPFLRDVIFYLLATFLTFTVLWQKEIGKIEAIVVEYKTKTGRTQRGVATNWLKMKKPDNGIKPRVPIYVRKSQFRLPFKSNTPVIMIGPGTGLAPFRGFIQERFVAKRDGKPVGDTVLYFGCRHKAEDFIYHDELEDYEKDGTLTQMHLAFSRDQEHKVYVQHLLEQNSEETWKLLENGGHIYVCGDARNMARDVHNVILKVLMEKGNMDNEKAENYIKKMQNKGRYSCDYNDNNLKDGSTQTSCLKVGNELLTTPHEIRNGWANYFQELASPHHNKTIYHNQVELDCLFLEDIFKSNQKSQINVSENFVKEVICQLKNGKAADSAGICSEHLKYCGETVVHILTKLINLIFRHCTLPELFEMGLVSPVFKNKGKPATDPNSYRKITVSSVINKVTEKLHLNDNSGIIEKNTKLPTTGVHSWCISDICCNHHY